MGKICFTYFASPSGICVSLRNMSGMIARISLTQYLTLYYKLWTYICYSGPRIGFNERIFFNSGSLCLLLNYTHKCDRDSAKMPDHYHRAFWSFSPSDLSTIVNFLLIFTPASLLFGKNDFLNYIEDCLETWILS